MGKQYEEILELRDYYNDMKKKHPTVDIWDDLIKNINDKIQLLISKYDKNE